MRPARLAALVALGALVLASCQLPVGGPANSFGDNLPAGCTDPTAVCAGAQPNLWAAINGPFTRHQDGDPDATMCSGDIVTHTTCDTNYGTTGTGGAPLPAAIAQNPGYDPNGYSWNIDVPAADVGQPITVQIYDPAISNSGSPLFENTASPTTDFHTSYELFQTTGKTDDVEETPALSMSGKCTSGPGANVFGFGTNPGAPDFFENWFTLCTFTPAVAGVYPLQVKTSNIGGVVDGGTGWNAYSVRATAPLGPQPAVSGHNRASIWTVQPGTVSRMYLANIGPQKAGHHLVVDFFDPGDGSGPDAFTLRLVAPPSGLGVIPAGGSTVACHYNVTSSATVGPATPDVSPTCTVTTKFAGSGSGVYNGAWLRLSLDIPTTYTCTTDCYWWLQFDHGTGSSTPTDRLTFNYGFSS